jgi:hypothetical protein
MTENETHYYDKRSMIGIDVTPTQLNTLAIGKSVVNIEKIDHLFRGLRILAESAFPKYCSYCNKHYETAEQFLAETQGTHTSSSGLMESIDDEEKPIIEAYRNCSCGSTLVEFFNNRRGSSEADDDRRKEFGELLESLIKAGVAPNVARNELLIVVRGGKSEFLENMKNP